MKRVSFECAKALKDAGYPQGITPYQYVTKDYDTFKEGDIIDAFYENWAGDNVIDAPFALEIWLWLWREKHIAIELIKNHSSVVFCINHFIQNSGCNDPEEAIEAAIEYLATNKLLK